MECRYCQALNADDDHRCGRCGRRLRMTPVYAGTSSAAPVLNYDQAPRAVATTAEAPAAKAPARKPITYQPSLFASRELPRVVPFESIAPTLVEAPANEPVVSKPRVRRPRVIPGQQTLEFTPSGARRVRPPEGVIYCKAPVAVLEHRALAVAMDLGMMALGLSFFGGALYFSGGQLNLSMKSAPMLIAMVAGVVLLYKLLWCIANGDTPGMRWTPA